MSWIGLKTAHIIKSNNTFNEKTKKENPWHERDNSCCTVRTSPPLNIRIQSIHSGEPL